jgi:hypothetical protein
MRLSASEIWTERIRIILIAGTKQDKKRKGPVK